MPKSEPASFFFLFVRPPSWCSVLEGLGRVASFPQRILFVTKGPSHLTALETARSEPHPHPPFPYPRRVFTSFLGCTFSYRSRFPPQTNEREHTKYIKTRLALPLFFDTNTRPYDHGKALKHQTPFHISYIPRKDPPPLVSARTHSIPFTFLDQSFSFTERSDELRHAFKWCMGSHAGRQIPPSPSS